MLNLALLALLQIGAPVAHDPIAGVRGVVRTDQSGVLVAGASVEAAGVAAIATSDALGTYAIERLGAGAHRLRFSARGFEPQVIDVILIDGVALSLDVSLTPIPAQIAPVKVLALPRPGRVDADIAREPGVWALSGERIRSSSSLIEGDAFRLLATSPQAHMLPESPASVHVRGGASDQNLFLLDGAPVFSPVHPGHLLSAFSPDIIDVLVLHGAAPSAEYGGGLSGIVDVRTPSLIGQKSLTRGEFGPIAARSSIGLPFASNRVGLMLSARHSYSGMRRQDLAESSMPGTWFDLFGKLALRVGGNEFALSSFAADNGLGFPASTSLMGVRNNSFEWATATQSASWRRDVGKGRTLSVVAWRAHFDGSAAWNPDSSSLLLRSAVRDQGLSGKIVIPQGRAVLSTGFRVEHLSSSYDVRALTSSPDSVSANGFLRRRLAPTSASFFAEERMRWSTGWSMASGLRAAFVAGLATRFEPRIGLSYQPAERWTFSGGFARMHQYSQSLRGEESLLGTIVGPDFLVGAGRNGVPVASSSELTASAAVCLREATSVRFDVYSRRMRGIVFPSAASSDPFATTGYTIGVGEAWGAGTGLETQIGKLSVNAVYSLSMVSRNLDSLKFRPAFVPRQSGSLALGYDATRRMSFHTALWGASGRPTTVLTDDIGWDTRDALTAAREVSGSPQHAAGQLDGSRLPYFFRWDIGARYALPFGNSGAGITAFGGVNNVLGRANKTGYVRPASGPPRDLKMLPTSLVLGLEWSF